MNILNTLKVIVLRFIDLLVILLALAVGLSLLSINGVFMSNVANCIIAEQYWDVSIGIQAVLLVLALVWLPIFIINMTPRSGRRQ